MNVTWLWQDYLVSMTWLWCGCRFPASTIAFSRKQEVTVELEKLFVLPQILNNFSMFLFYLFFFVFLFKLNNLKNNFKYLIFDFLSKTPPTLLSAHTNPFPATPHNQNEKTKESTFYLLSPSKWNPSENIVERHTTCNITRAATASRRHTVCRLRRRRRRLTNVWQMAYDPPVCVRLPATVH